MPLSAESLTKNFFRESKDSNCFSAVEELSLRLEEGTVTVLTGRSGGGKTTVLNMMSGLLVPTKGRVLLDDTDIYSLTDKELSKLRNDRFGVVPQGQTAIHSLNVIENILLPYAIYGEKTDDAVRNRADDLLQRLDIAQLSSAKPAQLSGGELRRMAIARAVIKKPNFIFADEPTGDLDDENTKTVFEFFRSAADEGAAVLIVTHEECAAEYADRVIKMASGKIV
ncbi:MAG: ABC transporter ATP-binding protein [Ruminococcus sp.]|nr:ABC transporter ATP-binding protein [Ruminococcus sp.]